MKFVKLLSVVLVLALTVSMALPAAAADSVEIVASGQCGENAYWKLDSDGILFITGSGSMYDFSAHTPAPWAYFYNAISTVIVSSGITSIGGNAFWCPNPFLNFYTTSITIPQSVTYIDPTAFQSCPYLQEVYYGDTYDQWVKLIENTQEEILHRIKLHASDRDVNMCGIYTQWKYADGTLTISGNGPMMDWSMFSHTPWDLSRECIYTTKIVVEQGVTHVGNWAFYGSWAKELILADSVVSVGNYAFQGCDFETVQLGSNLMWIGESAFEGCDCLFTVTLPNTLTAAGPFAFRGCTKLLAANLGGLTTLSQELFAECSNLIAIYIPSSVSKMEQGAFQKSVLRHVFYEGSAAQFQKICDDGGNEAVTGAKTQYDADANTAAYYLENIHLLCDHDYGDWTNEGATHNRICWICNYTDAVEHSWDEGKVTREPRCDHGGTTTYKCTTCDATKKENIEKLEHTFDEKWTKHLIYHRRYCTVCSYCEQEEHIWDEGKVTREPTCKTWGTYHYTCILCYDTDFEILEKLTTHTYDHACDTDCNICGATRTITHDYYTVWHSDGEQHWCECSICKARTEEAAHTPGAEATETTAQTCTTCGYVMKNVLEHRHSYGTTWITDGVGHWYACIGCAETSGYAVHDFENSCDIDCSICGFTRDITHKFTETWISDENGHWYVCAVCGLKPDETAHHPGAAATATTAQTCTICGYEMAPPLGVEETTNPTILTDAPTLPVDLPTIPTDEPTLPAETPAPPTEVPTDVATLPTEVPTTPVESQPVPTDAPTVPTNAPNVPESIPDASMEENRANAIDKPLWIFIALPTAFLFGVVVFVVVWRRKA